MNKEQVIKILKVCIIATAIMLGFEGLFSFDVITNWFGNLIVNAGVWTYVVIWAIMFLQVTILNIPAYVILSASVSIGINTLSFEFIGITISAYMAGCLLAYWLGWKFGKRAVKWCAGSEEDYNKWCEVLNSKGKLWYLLTVVFPLFPDDLICLVAGSVKFNFWFYAVANLIGRTIGLITMLYTLKLIGMVGSGFPFMIIVWGVALVGELVAYLVLRRKNLRKLSKIFCKHNYLIFFADTLEPIEKEENKDGIRIKHKIKAGCCICCEKCGKEKKRLSKKIGRYYANTLSRNYIQRLEKEVAKYKFTKK